MLAGIQADDLTGACDTGAPFAARGLETLVLVGEDGASPLDGAGEAVVVVVDTESRGRPADEARARARGAAAALAAAGPTILYKKLDSTLRGQVAPELLGMLEGAGRSTALLAPAFPAQGRTVRDGELMVGGWPVTEGAVARDPTFPRTGASVLALLADGGARPLGALPLCAVRRPGDAHARIARFAGVGGQVLVADAEDDADLAVLAAAVEGAAVLVAGSAGLATALAARLPAAGATVGATPRLAAPVLVVAGSPHPVTRAQVARLRARAGAGPAPSPLEIIAPEEPDVTADPARRRAAAARLGAQARAAAERRRPGLLVLTGGDTAIAVLEAAGARGLRVLGEVTPGLALTALAGGPLDGVLAVTKAGGFGDAEALVRIWERCA